MEEISKAIQESGLNSSPELLALCEKVYQLGRKSILDAQYLGRKNSPNFKGRGIGSKDKKKHGRDLTKKYKYLLFHLKASPFLTDMNTLRAFAQKVQALEVIDKKLYTKLRKEIDMIRNVQDLNRLQDIGRQMNNED